MSPRLHPPATHSPLDLRTHSSHSGTQPPTQHSAFFSTTYAVPILQVLLFYIHPSNGGVYPPCWPCCPSFERFSSFHFPVSCFQFPLSTARPAQCPPSRLPRPQTAQSGPGKAPRDRCSSS